MMNNMLTVTTTVKVSREKSWEYWTSSEHIIHWNFANDNWHCPKADNNLVPGGEFHYLMSAKDNSFSFDFWGTYQNINVEKSLDILLGDGRKIFVSFETSEQGTVITEIFEPESTNPVELQQTGWQMILDNFKKYAESLMP